jgi:hypothetical protein
MTADGHPTVGDLTYEHLAGLVMSNSGINHRLDRVDERLGRVERRLELRDGADA